MITEVEKLAFQAEVLNYYASHGRHSLPWRQPRTDQSFDPYTILVSEIMLQQTQVGRVIDKFETFMARFPDTKSLADALQGEVLVGWSGLGYNRRAKYLQIAARQIEVAYSGIFPDELADLVALPGVGKNTAGAILAYAFNKPAIFIETNIRTVFLTYFLSDKEQVSDSELLDFVADTVDTKQPRVWYWALMDYGAYLKKIQSNPNVRSKHYSKQDKFEGSRRQIRGKVLRELASQPLTQADLSKRIADQRLDDVLVVLVREEMIRLVGGYFRL